MGNEGQRVSSSGPYFFDGFQVHEGYSVTVNGIPHQNSQRFSISLCCGPSPDHDVALKFDVRFNEHCVVRNSKHNGNVGEEEREGYIPFSRGVNFTVVLTALPDAFEIFVNGANFCVFKHRMPKELVIALHIEGEVTVHNVQHPFLNQAVPVIHREPLLYPHPDQPPAYSPIGPILDPTVPLNIPVHGGMVVGRYVYIAGRVLDVDRTKPTFGFAVSLACGAAAECDKALDFEVRLRHPKDVNVVIRNAKQNGCWGTEEREITHFPFLPVEAFEIMILATDAAFLIAVNGQHYVKFNHRLFPITKAAHLKVEGDISLSELRFQ